MLGSLTSKIVIFATCVITLNILIISYENRHVRRGQGLIQIVDTTSISKVKPKSLYVHNKTEMVYKEGRQNIKRASYSSEEVQHAKGKILVPIDPMEQPRDERWAKDSEVAIRQMAYNIPFVAATTLNVVCRTTVCVLTGQTVSSSDANRSVTASYVVNERFAEDGSDANILPLKASYGEINSNGYFVITFARVRR